MKKAVKVVEGQEIMFDRDEDEPDMDGRTDPG
jgi:hypothetical protein